MTYPAFRFARSSRTTHARRTRIDRMVYRARAGLCLFALGIAAFSPALGGKLDGWPRDGRYWWGHRDSAKTFDDILIVVADDERASLPSPRVRGRHPLETRQMSIDWKSVYLVEGNWVRMWLSRRMQPSEVEDMLHNVFARALRYAHTYDPTKGKMTTWLTRIAQKELWTHMTRRAKQPIVCGSNGLDRAAATNSRVDLREPMPPPAKRPPVRVKPYKSERYSRFDSVMPLSAVRSRYAMMTGRKEAKR